MIKDEQIHIRLAWLDYCEETEIETDQLIETNQAFVAGWRAAKNDQSN